MYTEKKKNYETENKWSIIYKIFPWKLNETLSSYASWKKKSMTPDVKQYFAWHVAYVSPRRAAAPPPAPLRMAPCAAYVLMMSACFLCVWLCFFYNLQ